MTAPPAAGAGFPSGSPDGAACSPAGSGGEGAAGAGPAGEGAAAEPSGLLPGSASLGLRGAWPSQRVASATAASRILVSRRRSQFSR
ncbi:hypothetical protein E4O86_21330 [Rhizobiales bacterium L72]|uniref:Uncharacterized protein n=1 Tax=Propylenella binzhouense TaxID=2555902 RepID=A0A964WVW7_9HYPH|nr:hypothetical protein [Propylenella binzhouense]